MSTDDIATLADEALGSPSAREAKLAQAVLNLLKHQTTIETVVNAAREIRESINHEPSKELLRLQGVVNRLEHERHTLETPLRVEHRALKFERDNLKSKLDAVTARVNALVLVADDLKDKLRVSEQQNNALGDANVLSVENERLKNENYALRDAVIEACDRRGASVENDLHVWALRQTANRTGIPFSIEAVEAAHAEVLSRNASGEVLILRTKLDILMKDYKEMCDQRAEFISAHRAAESERDQLKSQLATALKERDEGRGRHNKSVAEYRDVVRWAAESLAQYLDEFLNLDKSLTAAEESGESGETEK